MEYMHTYSRRLRLPSRTRNHGCMFVERGAFVAEFSTCSEVRGVQLHHPLILYIRYKHCARFVPLRFSGLRFRFGLITGIDAVYTIFFNKI